MNEHALTTLMKFIDGQIANNLKVYMNRENDDCYRLQALGAVQAYEKVRHHVQVYKHLAPMDFGSVLGTGMPTALRNGNEPGHDEPETPKAAKSKYKPEHPHEDYPTEESRGE